MPYKHTTKSGKRDMRYKRENNPFRSNYSGYDYNSFNIINNGKQKKHRYYIPIVIIAFACFIGVFLITPSIKKAEMQKKKTQSEATIQIINSTTVLGGYKPCFGTNNAFSDANKIAICGAVYYNSINDVFKIEYADDLEKKSTQTNSLSLDRISARSYFTNNNTMGINTFDFPYYGIIFLTKNNNTYLLDNIVPYYYQFEGLVKKITSLTLIQYSESEKERGIPILDTWILENADK